jgi:hypothetical protein
MRTALLVIVLAAVVRPVVLHCVVQSTALTVPPLPTTLAVHPKAYWYDAASSSAAMALVWETSRGVLVTVRSTEEELYLHTCSGQLSPRRVAPLSPVGSALPQAVQHLWARVRRPTALPGPHAALLASVRKVTTDQEELVVFLHKFLATQPNDVADALVALLDAEAASRRVAVEHALDWVLAGYRLLLPFCLIYVAVAACSGGGGQGGGEKAARPAAVRASAMDGHAAADVAAHQPARVGAPAQHRQLTAPLSAAAAPAGAEEHNTLALTPTRRSARRAIGSAL